MKKLLLSAAVIAYGDLQAMWLESKIKKILPKCSYILSAVVREPMKEEKTLPDEEEKKGSPKNISILSTETSRTMHNDMFLLSSPEDRSTSELTITSSVKDNEQSIVSSFPAIDMSNIIQEEKIVTPMKLTLPILSFKNMVPIYEEEGIFDMEMSALNANTSSVEQSPFEYIPIAYRAKHPGENAEISKNQPYDMNASVMLNRRRSSLESYYHAHK